MHICKTSKNYRLRPSRSLQTDSFDSDSDSDSDSDDSVSVYKRVFNKDDFNKILDKPGTSNKHADILDWIEDEKLCLYSKEEKKGKSLIKILLEEVCNGHEVVEKVMDSYITTKYSDPNSSDFKVKIDFTGLMEIETNREAAQNLGLCTWLKRHRNQTGDSVLDDIVNVKYNYEENFWDYFKHLYKGKKENCCSKPFLSKFQS